MTDISTSPNSESTSDTVSVHTKRQTPRRPLWLIIGGVGGVMLLCVVLAVVVISRIVLSVSNTQAAVTPVIDQFLQAMQQRDAQRAYQLFSSRAQRQTPLEKVEELLDGQNYVLFDGYQTVTVDITSVSNVASSDPDVPQGEVATVKGTVHYAEGVQGSLQATLEKEQESWRLFYISVVVPPSKTITKP